MATSELNWVDSFLKLLLQHALHLRSTKHSMDSTASVRTCGMGSIQYWIFSWRWFHHVSSVVGYTRDKDSYCAEDMVTHLHVWIYEKLITCYNELCSGSIIYVFVFRTTVEDWNSRGNPDSREQDYYFRTRSQQSKEIDVIVLIRIRLDHTRLN